VLLSRKARAAIGLLTHPLARRLTWRERVVLQALVRGQSAQALAPEAGVGASALSERLAAAQRRLAIPWRRRTRARRQPPADLTELVAALEAYRGDRPTARRRRYE
jgi:FixJ family two-component response regulator